MSKDSRDVVIGFCEAWERRSLEDILAYMAPDIAYQNVPAPTMNGRQEAATFITPLLTHATRIEFKLLSIAVSASGEDVLTERVDRLHFPTGVVDIPLMGVFVVRDGMIAQWRDYADNASVMQAFADARIDLTKPEIGPDLGPDLGLAG